MTALMDYAPVLSRFDDVRPWPPTRDTASARCPLNRHKSGRLGFWIKGGKLLFGCWAGCTAGSSAAKLAVLNAVGLTWAACFPPDERGERLLPTIKPSITAVYPYRDEARTLLYECVRFEPGFNGRKKDIRYRQRLSGGEMLWNIKGVRRVLYRLPELLADWRTPVCVVEGEKKADMLAMLNLTSTTNPMGAAGWRLEYGSHLAGRRVAVFPDANEAGNLHAMAVAASCIYWEAESVRVVHLPGLSDGAGVDDFLTAMPMAERYAALVREIREAKEWRPS